MDILIRPYEEMDFEPVTTVWFASWESIGLNLDLPSIRGELRERLPREIANGWGVHVAISGGNRRILGSVGESTPATICRTGRARSGSWQGTS